MASCGLASTRALVGAADAGALSSRQHAGSAGGCYRRRCRCRCAIVCVRFCCSSVPLCTVADSARFILPPSVPPLLAASLRPAAARLPRRQRSTRAAAAKADAPPRRVVVTGQGVVSSLGHSPEEFYNNLLAGKSGVSLIEGWDTCERCCAVLGLLGWVGPSLGARRRRGARRAADLLGTPVGVCMLPLLRAGRSRPATRRLLTALQWAPKSALACRPPSALNPRRLPPSLAPPADFSTKFAGQIKQQPNTEGLVAKKLEKRVDAVMKCV